MGPAHSGYPTVAGAEVELYNWVPALLSLMESYERPGTIWRSTVPIISCPWRSLASTIHKGMTTLVS